MTTSQDEPFETVLQEILTPSAQKTGDAELLSPAPLNKKTVLFSDPRRPTREIPDVLEVVLRIAAAFIALGLLVLFSMHLIAR